MAGRMSAPATRRQDQPIDSATPTKAGPAAIPRLPAIPCQPIEPEAECEEEPEGERIRMEIVAPCEIQEHRDREDVRMHHAVQEPEEGDDLPILPSHSTTTR